MSPRRSFLQVPSGPLVRGVGAVTPTTPFLRLRPHRTPVQILPFFVSECPLKRPPAPQIPSRNRPSFRPPVNTHKIENPGPRTEPPPMVEGCPPGSGAIHTLASVRVYWAMKISLNRTLHFGLDHKREKLSTGNESDFKIAQIEVRENGKIPPKSLACAAAEAHPRQNMEELAPKRRQRREPSSRLTAPIRSMNDLLSRHSPGFSLLEAYTVTLNDSSHKIRKERSRVR